jgi:hypothetical protein
LRCKDIISWERELVDKRLISTVEEIGIISIVVKKNKDNWQKTGLCLSKYDDNCGKVVKKNEIETRQ